MACRTCEDSPKVPIDDIFKVRACRRRDHFDWAVKRIKRHTLIAHPVNMLRAVAAGLRGEQL